jgi:thiol:disulfide interchange protein
MIPITISVISGTAKEDQSRWRTLSLTLTYVTGMALL